VSANNIERYRKLRNARDNAERRVILKSLAVEKAKFKLEFQPTDPSRNLIASMPATAQHRRLALAIIILLSVVFALIMPFARAQPGPANAFIPVVQTVLCFADLITAVFLFAQYSMQPQCALLALASGYICSGLFAFLQTLDFPGAYSTNGLFRGGPSGAAWLFSLWHIAVPFAVMLYAFLKDGDETVRLPLTFPLGRTIAVTVGCVLVVTAGLTWVVAKEYLPSTLFDFTRMTPFQQYWAGGKWMLNAAALLLLFVRMRTILDLWLAVTLLVLWPCLALSFLYPVVRFSVGEYAAHTYALIASGTVLCVLLAETTILNRRLASAIVLQQRERANRLMSVEEATGAVAHEVAQPLTAISLCCSTALHWLKATPPNLEEASADLTTAINNSERAAEVVASTRKIFKPISHERTPIDLNGVARQVLGMLEHDLHEHRVSVSTKFQDDLPQITGDRTQLQQVILNLIKNAIDAMNAGRTSMRNLRLITTYHGNSVVTLSVQDSGPGIDPSDEARIFDAFFTTKSSGTGLGLSICRRIVEGHGGELRLANHRSVGCTFEISLPALGTSAGGSPRR
jgi:signal transduction histidine kinase